MRHRETRLREALDKRASEVTASTHHVPDTDHVVTHRHGPRPRLYVLAAAVVALVLAAVSWIVIANRPGIRANPPLTVTSVAVAPTMAESTETAAKTEPSASTAPSPPATPTAAPTSHLPGDYPRPAIPWPEVGTSWSYVEYAMSDHPESWALFLVSPWGARFAVGTYDESLIDVSGDGRRILLKGKDSVTEVVDVATGTKQMIRGPIEDTGAFAAFTGPTGRAVLLLESGVGAPNRLRKIDLQAGSTQWSIGTHLMTAQSSPNGRYVVGTTDKPAEVLMLDNATGMLAATVPTPAGTGYCYPRTWWSDDELLMSCEAIGDRASSRWDLWRYSLSTHALTRVTRTTTAQGGFNSAYPSGVGTVVEQTDSCGPGPIGILNSDGTTYTPLKNIPKGGGTAPSLIGVVGTTAFLLFSPFLTYGSCRDAATPSSSYVAYDLVSGTPVTLASGKLTGSGVYDARLVT